MTSSVERKQYEWKHEAEMTFFSKASVAENRVTQHSKKVALTNKSTILTDGKSNG